MIKIYQNYLIGLFFKKILVATLIFSLLIFILSMFEEVNFFKDLNIGFFYPLILVLLNIPSTLFLVFPFIFFLSAQFLFIDLIKKNELDIFKIHSLDNLKIIKILFFSSFVFGLFISTFFYSFSAKLKFIYLDYKNDYSKDNKYLATSTENGLWIKDEINNSIYIINAKNIEDEHLNDVIIMEFNKNFTIKRIINAETINIKNTTWIIYNPVVANNNVTTVMNENITLVTHFDNEKINNLFDNLSSISLFEFKDLIKDYNEMGYSTDRIKNHLYKILILPIYLGLVTVLSSIIMLNIKRSKSMIFHILFGVMLCVIIYYLNYLFGLLGETDKIPSLLSIIFPLFILFIINTVGLVRINEK